MGEEFSSLKCSEMQFTLKADDYSCKQSFILKDSGWFLPHSDENYCAWQQKDKKVLITKMEEKQSPKCGGKDTAHDSFWLRQTSYAATYPRF